MRWPICRGYVGFLAHFSKGFFFPKSNPGFSNFWSEVPWPQIFRERTQVEDGAVFFFNPDFFCWVKQEGFVVFVVFVGFKVVKSVFWDMCCFFLRFALRTDTVYVIL